MNLDDELRAALRRGDPPLGFAARVVASAKAKPSRASVWAWFRMPRVAWVGAMAALVSIGLVADIEHTRLRAERASRDATLALRITTEKLNLVRAKLQKIQTPPGLIEN